ncbi:MAG: exodeoxyribonuclease VII large subunit, partial [Planctomycetes bacterium]|nr:exodeoxyribonuclease VII large subunit [Planctomycetota bacterium]
IDVTLADLAADVRALTPSEAAERVVPSSQDVAELMRSLHTRLQTALKSQATALRSRLDALASRPALARPLDTVHNLSRQIDDFAARLHTAANINFRDKQSRLAAVSGKLDTLSPLSVLGRGYSVTQDHRTGQVITSARRLRQGQSIQTRFAEGTAISTVGKIERT